MRSLIADIPEGKTRPSIKPEERLLLAVVESAYWDLRSSDPARQRTARVYFLDESDHHTFSFISICQHFSWSPTSIRNQLSGLLEALPAADHVQWNGGKPPTAARRATALGIASGQQKAVQSLVGTRRSQLAS